MLAETTTVAITFIVGFFSVLTISIPLWFARQNRMAEWEREDKVAARVETVAKRAETAALRVGEVAEEAAFQAKSQGAKLDQIHALVNSNVTELKAAQLVSLKEILALKRGNNLPDDETALNTISALEKELAYRDRVTKAAETVRANTERTRIDDPPNQQSTIEGTVTITPKEE